MANPQKPPRLKAIAGTNQPCRDKSDVVVDLPVVSSAPDAPNWLPNAHACKEWDRLAPILCANGLLTEGGLSALGVLCSLHGKIVQLFSAGETPTGHMVAQYRNLINDFGLTPAAQGKVKVVGGNEKPENKFAKNGKRAAGGA
jgi:phage terminase small subunit